MEFSDILYFDLIKRDPILKHPDDPHIKNGHWNLTTKKKSIGFDFDDGNHAINTPSGDHMQHYHQCASSVNVVLQFSFTIPLLSFSCPVRKLTIIAQLIYYVWLRTVNELTTREEITSNRATSMNQRGSEIEKRSNEFQSKNLPFAFF